MNNLNSILIEGNIVREPETRTTTKGTSVSTFAIATNRYYRQETGKEMEKEVSFFNVETWAKLAERVNVQAKKGRGIRVVGRLKQERWLNREGKNQSKIVIVAEHVEFRPEFKKDSPVEEEKETVEEREYEENLVPTF